MTHSVRIICLGILILLAQSCTKNTVGSATNKSEIKVNFKGKSYTITPVDYPSLYAATMSLPIANSTGGQQQISRVSFYGENSQIAIGTAAFKKGGPEGTYAYETLMGWTGFYWKLGAFYQYSDELPSLSLNNTVPAPGEIIAIVLVDKSAGNVGYLPIPATSTVSVTTSTDKQISGSFNLQVKNGTTTETVTGTFSFVK